MRLMRHCSDGLVFTTTRIATPLAPRFCVQPAQAALDRPAREAVQEHRRDDDEHDPKGRADDPAGHRRHGAVPRRVEDVATHPARILPARRTQMLG
jgi:hypothetical protein